LTGGQRLRHVVSDPVQTGQIRFVLLHQLRDFLEGVQGVRGRADQGSDRRRGGGGRNRFRLRRRVDRRPRGGSVVDAGLAVNRARQCRDVVRDVPDQVFNLVGGVGS